MCISWTRRWARGRSMSSRSCDAVFTHSRRASLSFSSGFRQVEQRLPVGGVRAGVAHGQATVEIVAGADGRAELTSAAITAAASAARWSQQEDGPRRFHLLPLRLLGGLSHDTEDGAVLPLGSV